MRLWEKTPGFCEEIPQIYYFKPKTIRTDAAIIIFPGGGYSYRAQHEGEEYAEFFSNSGIHAFVVDYRVAPHYFPLPLLDARRAVRFVRAHAEEYGINKEKIATIGSSAGGHLVALLSTYNKPIEYENVDSVDEYNYLPNAQILCYPVICPPRGGISHGRSYRCLIGKEDKEIEDMLDPCSNVGSHTPMAFVWHAFDDENVNVINSYNYCIALKKSSVSTELHIFQNGGHGCGLAIDKPHTAQWSNLLLNWFKYNQWLM